VIVPRASASARSRATKLLVLAFAVSAAPAAGQTGAAATSRNRPERLEWFRDAGFGLFIHWSVDVQIGSVISHSLVGASPDYTRRFFEELPRSFNPRRFEPREWAELARLAGMKYVVFTAKHHSGFCMYHTRTTDFSVSRTPFGRDVTREVLEAFRAEGLAAGLYFSPDDFHYLHRAGKPVARAPHPGVTPMEDPTGLLRYDQEQLRELMTGYGPIDVVFIDGPPEGLRELVWELQPEALVTRGAIETPEQRIPGVPLDRPWEACLTMGTQWHYKPTHESYKSGPELVRILIETRAKGGNLLLNVGPKPNGELPIEQEERLREIALWMFVNGEAIHAVRPWVVTNEGDVWFTRRKDEDTVYAFLPAREWLLGERRSVTLRSVGTTARSSVSVLGQTGEVLEYRPDVDPRPKWREDARGLHVDVTMAQRLYNDRRWPNPVVLKITDARAALTPPAVATASGERLSGGARASLRGELRGLGGASEVQVAFQYRRRKGVEELYARDEPWQETAFQPRKQAGAFAAEVADLRAGDEYEFRAVARHPLLDVFGEEVVLPRAPAQAP
jgi:alpha-L-fucosidase